MIPPARERGKNERPPSALRDSSPCDRLPPRSAVPAPGDRPIAAVAGPGGADPDRCGEDARPLDAEASLPGEVPGRLRLPRPGEPCCPVDASRGRVARALLRKVELDRLPAAGGRVDRAGTHFRRVWNGDRRDLEGRRRDPRRGAGHLPRAGDLVPCAHDVSLGLGRGEPERPAGPLRAAVARNLCHKSRGRRPPRLRVSAVAFLPRSPSPRSPRCGRAGCRGRTR